MRVTLIASTQLKTHGLDLEVEHASPYIAHPIGSVTDADELSEISGRICYESWSRPNPATATNEGYLKNILDHGHLSVLEHSSATFLIQGVSRTLTHELVRHRHLSFSQLSQRFVSNSQEVVLPPALAVLPFPQNEMLQNEVLQVAQYTQQAYQNINQVLEDHGFSRKQAREAARAVLPNATTTSLVVTGNHRAFRDMIQKRYTAHADAEIYELAGELLRQLKELAPATYQDMELV